MAKTVRDRVTQALQDQQHDSVTHAFRQRFNIRLEFDGQSYVRQDGQALSREHLRWMESFRIGYQFASGVAQSAAGTRATT